MSRPTKDDERCPKCGCPELTTTGRQAAGGFVVVTSCPACNHVMRPALDAPAARARELAAPHVVWDNDDPAPPPVVVKPGEQMRLWCKHCGERHLIVLPASLPLTVGIMRLFSEEHARCEPRSPLGPEVRR